MRQCSGPTCMTSETVETELTVALGELRISVRRSSTPCLAARPPASAATAAASASAPASAAASATAAAAAAPKADAPSWEERLEWASAAGRAARQRLEGASRGDFVRRLSGLPGNRLYVILRNADAFVYEPAQVCRSWREARALVERTTPGARAPHLPDCSVFHGFASEREAKAYCAAAGVQWS